MLERTKFRMDIDKSRLHTHGWWFSAEIGMAVYGRIIV